MTPTRQAGSHVNKIARRTDLYMEVSILLIRPVANINQQPVFFHATAVSTVREVRERGKGAHL